MLRSSCDLRKCYAFLVWSLLAGLVWAQSGTWQEKGDARVRVFYHSIEEQNVLGLIRAVDQALPDLEAKIGVILQQPARIYITTTQEEFDRVTGRILPSWSEGVTFPETGSVVLKSPRFSHDIETFQRTALHELVHLLLARKAGSNVPRWLNEGLALLLSGEGAGKPLMPLSRALWSGTVMGLGEVEQVDQFPHARAELAYLESYHAAEFLIKQYGWDTMRRMLAGMGQGLYWEDALFRETALDQSGFEAAWREHLDKSYRWMLLLDVQTLLILAAIILVVWAFISMLRRRRKIYQKWAAEDTGSQGIF